MINTLRTICIALVLALSTSFGAQAKHADLFGFVCAMTSEQVEATITELKTEAGTFANCRTVAATVDIQRDLLQQGAAHYSGPNIDWQGDKFWVLQDKRGLYLWVWRLYHRIPKTSI